MRTFTEALQIIQEGPSRGILTCPKCKAKTGKDDDHDYGDCECGYRAKKATGTWKFETPEEPEKPAKKIPERPDKYGMFKKER